MQTIIFLTKVLYIIIFFRSQCKDLEKDTFDNEYVDSEEVKQLQNHAIWWYVMFHVLPLDIILTKYPGYRT